MNHTLPLRTPRDPAAATFHVGDSGAKLTVICGTDDAYVEFVPAFCQKLKAEAPDMKIILAGDPGENGPAYTEAGLDDFISIRSNVYEVNKKYLDLVLGQ